MNRTSFAVVFALLNNPARAEQNKEQLISQLRVWLDQAETADDQEKLQLDQKLGSILEEYNQKKHLSEEEERIQQDAARIEKELADKEIAEKKREQRERIERIRLQEITEAEEKRKKARKAKERKLRQEQEELDEQREEMERNKEDEKFRAIQRRREMEKYEEENKKKEAQRTAEKEALAKIEEQAYTTDDIISYQTETFNKFLTPKSYSTK